MTRSEINLKITSAIVFFETMQFKLPVWGYWSPDEWRANALDDTEIKHNRLGWDLTDFGSGRFGQTGLILFSIRNGILGQGQKSYCEKIMIAGENQVTPRHYHRTKMEDIINRGGGNLLIELYHSNESKVAGTSPVEVRIDGMVYEFSEGEKIRLVPGQSICLPPNLSHSFYGEEGSGRVLIGEVSAVNDDENDNFFADGVGRFPDIVEDEPPRYLLISDYLNE
ncbi:MAG: D-lyxose/D-mannose family sugar isomerase [Bacteroidetes bacterium]|nr:D-lyxose/D-mannose family sugar isomerase [Bacteroidota bacterium]